MTDQNSSTNQTRFSDEGMYFESTLPDIDPNAPKKPFFETKQGKYALIGLAVFGFLMMIIGLAIIAKSNQTPIQEVIEVFKPRVVRDLSETEQKVVLLKELLVTADPTKEQDPFPPINLTFRLDPSER